MAQKLHALTDPRTTERARDVLDILLIDTVGKLDYAEAAAAVVWLFAERETHALPWRFEMPSIWRREGVDRTVDSALTILYWHVGQRVRQEILNEQPSVSSLMSQPV